jgi:hypothetical protein
MGAKRSISSWCRAVTMGAATAGVATTVMVLRAVGAEVTEVAAEVSEVAEVEEEDTEVVTVTAHPVGADGVVVVGAEDMEVAGTEDL